MLVHHLNKTTINHGHPDQLDLRDIVGGSFVLKFQIVEGDFPAPRHYQVTVAVG